MESTDDIQRLAEIVLERGFTAIKTNLFPLKGHREPPMLMSRLSRATGDASPAVLRNAETIIGAFRTGLGPDVGIALDVAFTYKLGGAIKLAQALEPYDLMWLETETLDPEALALIRQSTKTTICTGESLFGPHQYKPFLHLHAQDILMPDFAWNGITMGKKICDLAHAYDVLIAPHACHSPLNTLISAAVAATIPNFFILEYDEDDAPWRNDILSHPLEIEKGYLKLSDRPGLGADLVETELRKHPPGHYPGVR